MEWWKAPDWDDLGNGHKYCKRCGYAGSCRCSWCGRCDKVTGNNTQGHYWKFCEVTGDMREFHFCCPDDCELETA